MSRRDPQYLDPVARETAATARDLRIDDSDKPCSPCYESRENCECEWGCDCPGGRGAMAAERWPKDRCPNCGADKTTPHWVRCPNYPGRFRPCEQCGGTPAIHNTHPENTAYPGHEYNP